MSALGWLAAAGVVLAVGGPGAALARVAELAGRGRLAAVDQIDRPADRLHRGARRLPVLLLGAGTVPVWLAGGAALGVAAASAGGALWLVARDLARRRETMAARAELLAALRVLVGELEAGARPAAALLGAAETGPRCAAAFRAAAAAATGSGDAAAVLERDTATRLVGVAWRLGEDAGVALAGVLARVAADLAALDAQASRVAVALSGPRSSAVVLATLPGLGLALGAAMGARPWSFLLGSSVGRGVCCAGVLLDVAGVLWMGAILRRAERP
jgi:tight adherence protein B